MTMSNDAKYGFKRLLQANISFAGLMRKAGQDIIDAADYLEQESIAINSDMQLPGFDELEPPGEGTTPEHPPFSSYQIPTRYGPVTEPANSAIQAEWPQHLWVNAAELSKLESGWNPRAQNDTLEKGPCGTQYYIPGIGPAMTEDSRGLYQINVCAHGGGDELYDPYYNARKGYELYQSSGWNPWYYSATALGLL